MQIRSIQQENPIHLISGQILAQDFTPQPTTKIQNGEQINQHGNAFLEHPMGFNRRQMAGDEPPRRKLINLFLATLTTEYIRI